MRSSGVLLHISSLPSPHGVGSMGKPSREFVDFLKKAGQSWWQILPVCPTSYGDSPYQSFSTFAGNPYFIDLDDLETEGLLRRAEYEDTDWESTPDRVNYGALYEKRYKILRLAAERFADAPSDDYDEFCKENISWLDDYAMFMALKGESQGKSWMEWEPALRNRIPEALEAFAASHENELAFWKITQYFFFRQWKKLRAYANEQGISIIGDLPIYVALDSVDVWAHPELFQLDENRVPKEVAGCPPDGFSADGQLWGNPLFDWEYMEQTGYQWWIERIRYQTQIYNVLRIDHFRGFDSYYAIPYGADSAQSGYWKQGPGMKLFVALEKAIGKVSIIAEDLGFLTDSVKQLLADSGFPGMKVLELAFDSRDDSSAEYLPHNFIPHCIAYAGTHDNDTIQGWMSSAAPEDVAFAKEYLRMNNPAEYHWDMMKALWSSVADVTIVQAQDLLGIGSEGRMNVPSTAENNWCWRAPEGSFEDALAEKLLHNMKLYGRC